MALFESLNRLDLEKICADFAFKKGDEKRLLAGKIYAKKIGRILEKKEALPPSKIFCMLEPLSYETILFVMARSNSLLLRKRIEDFFLLYNGAKTRISGSDLCDKGIPEGPIIKKILQETLCAKLDQGFSSKEEEIEYTLGLAGKFYKQ